MLDYLRAHGFSTHIVSGGGIDFIRAFAEEDCGIPPQNVIGSSSKASFQMTVDGPLTIKGPGLNSINDGPGKPLNINLHIGLRPIMTVGNSEGDLPMLQYTDSGRGPRFAMLVRHDDPEREWSYDRDSRIGHLDKALDGVTERGWTVVSLQKDWRKVHAVRD